MKILASYNIKGGVGKTATAVNLAWLAAREGARTLVWDLDPQGAASFYFRIEPKVKGGGKGLVKGKHELERLIKGTNYPNLDLLPADFSFRNLDLLLEEAKHPTKTLRKRLRELTGEYDYVFLDCPPSISLVSENIFRAADALLIPTIPTTLSLRTLKQLVEFCDEQALGVELLPFFSMVDLRKQLHRMIVEQPPQGMVAFLQSYIPYASDVERMGTARAAIGEFAGRSAAARAFEALWREVRAALPA